MKQSIFILLFFIGCSQLYYHPHKKIYLTPKKVNKAYKETSIKTPSGVNLKVWKIFSKKKGKKNLIVQFHGNAENMSTHMLSLVWLTDFNYDLLAFDYRGYGQSEGYPTPLGLREDSLAFLDHATKEHEKGHYDKLILVGQSIGGVVLMDALTHFKDKNKVDLLVLDSTFSSYRRMGLKVLQKSWITFLFSPIGYLITTDETSPKENLNKLTMNKLIIHSKNDPAVDYSEGKKLYKDLPSPKEFWDFEEESHIGSFFIKKGVLRSKFMSFIDKI